MGGSRSLQYGVVALLASCIDSTTTTGPVARASSPLVAAIELGTTPLAVDDHGIPRLLLGGVATPAMPAGDAIAAARMHLERLAPAWGVGPGAMPALEAQGAVSVLGGSIVRLVQVIDGLPVDTASGGEVHVMVGKDGSLVAASGTLLATDAPRAKFVRWSDDDAGAVARAVAARYGTGMAPAALAMRSRGADGARLFAGRAGSIDVSLARARKAWYADGKALVPAWIVEAYSSDLTSTDGDAYRTVLSADGRVLARTNLKADATFSYRVFAETAGEGHPFDGPIVDPSPNPSGVPSTVPFPNTPYPAFVPPNLVSVDGLNHPGGSDTPDPWLTADRTETSGNNVDAYTDVNPPDGLSSGDFRATTTAALTFDRVYTTTAAALSAQPQQMAGVTSLFYIVNWMHDFWYDGGFTEANGNAQVSNYGRGGIEGDPLHVEADDGALSGSRNNANMATPSDGISPRMQVFVWDNKDTARSLTIPSLSGLVPQTGMAEFAPASFNATGTLVIAADGTAPAADACQALAPATGKIVIADRSKPSSSITCTFKTKALNAQNAGAVALILVDRDDVPVPMVPPPLGDDPGIATPITIAVLSVTQADGAMIKTAASGGAATATLLRTPGPDLEGTLDATVVAHEFGHYVHHRLSVCDTLICGAMSEGWADFSALLMLTRAGDNLDGAFPVGVYSTRSFAPDPAYFGIRRAPYSVSPSINALSFRHMVKDAPLPTTHPFLGDPSSNNEVHNAGEVWASMLWEGYVALQKANQAAGATFEDVRLKMRKYVVAGLMLTPPNASPTATRDAILAAVYAVNPADHDTLAAAYARRGFGSCAVSPDISSLDFKGIVESTVVKGRIARGALAQKEITTCDSDDVLDAGEAGQISVVISNPGAVALSDVTATLSSAMSSLHITSPTVAVGAVPPHGTATATFDISIDETLTAAVASDLSIQIDSPTACAPVTVPIVVRLNTDDRANNSATDTFDAGASVWTPAGSADLWTHARKTALDGVWLGSDAGTLSDTSLVSPELTAGGGSLKVTFNHRFSFEYSPDPRNNVPTAWDGGVIEYSIDGGTTWQDVSTIASPGYNHTIATGDNPLSGRQAFSGTNPALPGTDSVTLDFAKHLANQTFQLRFRIGSDSNTGGGGWEINDVAFSGIAGKPFPTLADNTCGVIPDSGGCCDARGSWSGSSGAAMFVLAVVLRRRRQRRA